jgi:hypothetical protein
LVANNEKVTQINTFGEVPLARFGHTMT